MIPSVSRSPSCPYVVVYWEGDSGDLRYREFEDLTGVEAFLDRIHWQALVIGPDSVGDRT